MNFTVMKSVYKKYNNNNNKNNGKGVEKKRRNEEIGMILLVSCQTC